MTQLTFTEYTREVERRAALRAWKLSPHGQRRARWKRAVRATAAALVPLPMFHRGGGELSLSNARKAA